MLWNVGGIVTSLGFFGGVHLLRFTTPNEQSCRFHCSSTTLVVLKMMRSYNPNVLIYDAAKRLSLLFLSALLKGASIGPMIELAIEVDARYYLLSDNIL